MDRNALSSLKTTILLIGLGVALEAQGAPACPSFILSQPKGNALYLYFPTTADNTFPSYGGEPTSPLADFDVADLDSGIGTTAQLRDRVFDIVTDDYCEFNVKVNQATATPSPSETRWQIVGIGSDANVDASGCLFGKAQAVDTNDADPQDYARLWSDSFGECTIAEGGTAFNAAFSGMNSTLQRWATGIGETAAHEAAHNYGTGHGHSAPRAGSAEDAQNNHIMATGSTGLTGEIRASRDRHFSDTEYEILAHNVGLNIKTLHNWDFVNPNDTSANGMRIKLLSNASSLTVGWFYSGTRSPWTNPTVTNTGTTQSFQGTTYKVYDLDFTTAKSWDGGADGVVNAGAEFHTGASFSEADPVIVFRVQLLSAGNPLPLAPRLPGYDVGTADLATGDFSLGFFNTDPGAGDLIIRDLQVLRLPRMLDIAAMVTDARPVDIRGLPVEAQSSQRLEKMQLRESMDMPIARFSDKRSVDIVYGPGDCPQEFSTISSKRGATRGPGDAAGMEVSYCHKGNALSLFPATYTYVIATVVEPNAKRWDAAQNAFVNGELKSRLFYQVAGIVPDFNHNGTDDLIDIRTGLSPDRNANGVPDDAEPSSRECPCDLGLQRLGILMIVCIVLSVLVLLAVLLLVRRRT